MNTYQLREGTNVNCSLIAPSDTSWRMAPGEDSMMHWYIDQLAGIACPVSKSTLSSCTRKEILLLSSPAFWRT